jgi:hypothetical protein
MNLSPPHHLDASVGETFESKQLRVSWTPVEENGDEDED